MRSYMGLKELLVTIAGFVGGFVSILASNGSSVTLPALEFFGLSEHMANGTNRLSVVALGLIGIIHFLVRPSHWLQGKGGVLKPFDWSQAAAYFAIGVYAGLVVLGSGFFMLAALVLLSGYDLRHGNAMKAFILLIVGLQSLFVFDDRGEVD